MVALHVLLAPVHYAVHVICDDSTPATVAHGCPHRAQASQCEPAADYPDA